MAEISHTAGFVEWSQQGLVEWGFAGFVPFGQLPMAAVPSVPGVYVVALPAVVEPTWLDTSPAGHFKSKDPTVPVQVLQRAWVPNAPVLYIGKAGGGRHGRRGLCVRLDEYRRHGAGRPVGHWGGRYIWQMSQAARLLVAWATTPDREPEEVESALIADFVATYGQRPFANRKSGGRSVNRPD